MASLRQLVTLIEHLHVRERVTDHSDRASAGAASRGADAPRVISLCGSAGIEIEAGLLPAAPTGIA
jgi:hypothetical protein